MLEVLFPKVRRKLLILLLLNPDRGYHLREIIRILECGKGSVERELSSLRRVGILELSRDGNRTIYKANRESPVFSELQGLLLKTEGMADVIRSSLRDIPDIQIALIFGSAASGRMDRYSDIDLLVVGDIPFRDISKALLCAQKELGREIAPTVYSISEFQTRINEEHHFLARILSGPRIMLIGDEDEIERLGWSASG